MLDEVLGDNFIHWICEYEWSEVSIAILAFHLSLECIKDYLYIEHSIHHIKISKLCPTLKTGSAYTSFHGWNELNLNMYPNPLSTGTHFKLCIQILCQQELVLNYVSKSFVNRKYGVLSLWSIVGLSMLAFHMCNWNATNATCTLFFFMKKYPQLGV